LAADAIVAAEPEPVEYVRVCDADGTGYFYIPGTETCLKIEGYILFQVNVGEDVGGDSDWDAILDSAYLDVAGFRAGLFYS
ncbi:porin, partial [Rhizobium ruizarguesonis]